MMSRLRENAASDVAWFKRIAGPGSSVIDTLSAHYVRQRFAPHAHAEYLFGVIEAGCHAVKCKGIETLAAAGTLVGLWRII